MSLLHVVYAVLNTPLLPAVLIIESLVGVSHTSTLNKLLPALEKASMTLQSYKSPISKSHFY